MKRSGLLITLLTVLVVACGGDQRTAESPAPAQQQQQQQAAADQQFVLYSGRNEKLIGPLIEQFTRESGIRVEVRYGESAELAATLMEEGARTPADAFLSQDAAALAAVARTGLARPLPQDVITRVPSRFAADDGRWVGVSGRARTIVYNPSRINPEELPQSLEEVGQPRFRGRFGVAPLNASFQAQMAAYHALHGAEGLDRLLTAITANEPQRYAKNSAIVDAVANGEIEWGLVNHYYAWEAKRNRPDLPVQNFFMPRGDASSFINVAGVALLGDPDPDAAAFVRYLLSEPAQRYFAERTFEYPLVAGVSASVDLQPLEELQTPEIDFARVADSLEPALAKISESGLTRQ